jgi:hypothetical protein
MTHKQQAAGVTRIVGLAEDARDGHKRISHGGCFSVWMGSEETHEAMNAVCRELEARLVQSGKKLEDLTESEFQALASEING